MAFNPDRVHYFQQRLWAARSPFAKHAPQARRRGSVAPGFSRGGTLVRHCPAVPPLSPLLSWSHWVSLIHTCSSLPQPSLKDFQPGLDQPGAQYGPVARLPSFPFWLKVSWQASKSAGSTHPLAITFPTQSQDLRSQACLSSEPLVIFSKFPSF